MITMKLPLSELYFETNTHIYEPPTVSLDIMVAELPFDIIEAILDELVDGHDWETIRSLARTCFNLVDPCRKRLFTTIVIHRSTYPQLNSLFHSRPELTRYVHHLHYYIDGGNHRGDTDLLLLFSQLESLHIIGNEIPPSVDWNSLPDSLHKQIIRLLTCTALHALSVTQIRNLPIAFLGHCPNLRQLQLGDLHFDISGFTSFTGPCFPTPCTPTKLSLAFSTHSCIDQLMNAKWPNGSPIVNLSLITVLHDHSFHATLDSLLHVSSHQIEIFYFTGQPFSNFREPFLILVAGMQRFRKSIQSNPFTSLRLIIGNIQLTDLQRPINGVKAVEEIYFMVHSPSSERVELTHVLPWLKPTLFPSLRLITTFQINGFNSTAIIQLPFSSGAATFVTRKITDLNEFWNEVCSITAFSNYDY